MEKTKFILERIIKIIIITSAVIGIISSIFLFKFHVYNYPILISFCPQELILFLCMIGVFLLAIRFEVKYFKWLTLAGIILNGINLLGFNLLLKVL